jgi:hypothetical protein
MHVSLPCRRDDYLSAMSNEQCAMCVLLHEEHGAHCTERPADPCLRVKGTMRECAPAVDLMRATLLRAMASITHALRALMASSFSFRRFLPPGPSAAVHTFINAASLNACMLGTEVHAAFKLKL